MANEKIEKLKAQKKNLEARIRQEQNRERVNERKADTRRKILAGAWVMDEIAKRSEFKEFVYKHLETFLTRPDDRALFGLAPLPETKKPAKQ
jgi:hypothetical protein